MAKNRSKRPIKAVQPQTDKSARGLSKAHQSEVNPIAWHLRILDKDGRWGWKNLKERTLWDRILPRIVNFETMTWPEILGSRHHEIPVSKIISEAQRRLEALGQNDIDQLVSFHITGEQVIWGIRDQNIFKVLWWDPNHEICPSLKRHT